MTIIHISPHRFAAARRAVLAKNASMTSVKKTPDSKAAKCAKVLNGTHGERPFGCRTEYVARICEIMIGEKIELKSTSDYDFVPGTMVVLLKNPNDHNYPIGDPIYIYKNNEAISRTLMGKLTTGNCLPDKYDYEGSKKPFRLATPAEIDLFFDTTTPHYEKGDFDEEQVRKDLGL